MSHNSIVNGRAEAVALSQEEVKRYSRHLIMPEVGMAGQKSSKRPAF